MSPKDAPVKAVRKSLPHDVPLWLDASTEVYFLTFTCRERGRNQLCVEQTASALLESAAYRHEAGLWFVHLFLLMPDHAHGLFSFPPGGTGILRTVSAWKGWTAKCCGIKWQRDFFEHRLRREESFLEKAEYIRANPVRAGLIPEEGEWPWVLSASSRGGDLMFGG
jgi:putative transposase